MNMILRSTRYHWGYEVKHQIDKSQTVWLEHVLCWCSWVLSGAASKYSCVHRGKVCSNPHVQIRLLCLWFNVFHCTAYDWYQAVHAFN